jgi:16S rRNA (adenine1518-N6/adenine1519-N6)-dimethyltransferase
MCRWLAESFAGRAEFTLVPGDFLETWRTERDRAGPPDRILGNLPYRSASLMIAAIVEGELRPRRAIVTVQRELAQRMTARPGEKAYSSFTVLCCSCFEIEGKGDLQPGSFWPVPEVVSSIVELRPRPDAPAGASLVLLSRLSRAFFSARRKTLRNNAPGLARGEGGVRLEPGRVLSELQRAGIDPGMRAEQVPPEVWTAVARSLTGSAAP